MTAPGPVCAGPSPSRPLLRETGERTRLRVDCCRSIRDIDAGFWDAVNAREDLFHSHRFLRAVEDGKIEGAAFWYFVFRRDKAPVGTAVLSSFVVSLDLLTGNRIRKVVEVARRLLPGFLRVKVLFCGLPVSVSRDSLCIADPSCRREILDCLMAEMTRIAREQAIEFLCFKEFSGERAGLVQGLSDHGFFDAASLPEVNLDISWPDFASYMADLRHSYRRHVRRSLRKLGLVEPLPSGARAQAAAPKTPTLALGGPASCPPERFHELYRNVIDRAEVRLETLGEPFFRSLYETMGADMEVLVLAAAGDILGAALLMSGGGEMTFFLVGLDYSRRDEHDVYFNLIHGIVAAAIRSGCDRLRLGQTSYWVKQRVGGVPTPVRFYLRVERRWVHRLVRAFRPLLIPSFTPRPIRTFRERPLITPPAPEAGT